MFNSGHTFVEIPVNKYPSLLFIGENGHGKSVFLDALCYCLFKKPFRKVKKDQLVNTINNGDCVQEVEFSIGQREYKVCRGIKPDYFEIYIDGLKRNQGSTQKDDQKFLEEDILRTNYEAFTQIVILGHAKYTPFMQLKTPDRRDFIEYILDIGVFSSMNDLLKTRKDTIKIDIDGLNKDISLVTEQINMLKGFIKKLHEESLKVSNELVTKINDSELSISKLNDELVKRSEIIGELSEEINDQQEILDRIQYLNDWLYKIKDNINSNKTKIAFYTENDLCKTCGQDINDEHKHTIITEKQEQIDKYTKGLQKLQDELKIKQMRLGEIKQINQKILQENNKLQDCRSNIRAQQSYIQKLKNDVKKEPGNIHEQQIKLASFEGKLKNLELLKEELVEKRHFYDVSSVLLKDSGIKSAIIKQYLPTINKYVNHYLGLFGLHLNFAIDDQFNENFKMKNMNHLSYNSLSEGQKLRVDLSLLLTWREIAKMKSSCSANLLLLDEIFDSSLDKNGTASLYDILKELSKCNIIIISHRAEIMELFPNHVLFELRGPFSVTRMIEN